MSNGDKLLTAIEENGGTDVVIQYWDIARLFPSDVPHPDSFDYREIDHHALKEWAASNGFKVTTVPEQAPDHAKLSPPVRFLKII
ncbi:MAG: hypothetical protein JBO36_15470 [Candidatus Thiodiazotropha taylori]|nr:hypothetical protein [Candidatus Thiodiazotropha taylori]